MERITDETLFNVVYLDFCSRDDEKYKRLCKLKGRYQSYVLDELKNVKNKLCKSKDNHCL